MYRGKLSSIVVALTAAVVLSATACSPDQPYDIAVLGDVPYSATAVAKYDRMIADINAGSAGFSVHVGDIGPGEPSTCTRSTVDRETARFDTFARPLVYTPGDNEWTDCGPAKLDQLAYIRSQVFRGDGTTSRGRSTMALASQGRSGYPENARWQRGPVTFATLHVTGSRDDYANRSEHDPRRMSTIAWLRQTGTGSRTTARWPASATSAGSRSKATATSATSRSGSIGAPTGSSSSRRRSASSAESGHVRTVASFEPVA